jgi:hypothetical protein
MSAAIILTLCVWLLASILSQFFGTSLARGIKRLDLFDVVPAWTFFAPVPVSHDLALVVRCLHREGQTWSDWKVISQPARHSPILRTVWNPRSRIPKILHDFSQEIAAIRRIESEPEAALSIPYLCLLGYARSQVDLSHADCLQFGIIEYVERESRADIQGFVVLSGFHKL